MKITITELKSQKIWLCWNYKYNEKGKGTKVPISYKNTVTGVNKEYCETWCTYDEAITAKKKYSFDGIGLVISKGICGIDIDKRDLEDATTRDILSLFDTYAEKSPSGKGLHILLQVDTSKIPKDKIGTKLNEKYYQKNPHNKIESYVGGLTNRFFTFTGDTIQDKSINDCTEEFLVFLNKYMLKDVKSIDHVDSDILDKACEDVIEIIKRSKQAEKFEKLFFEGDIKDYDGDDSSADMALCDILAFYCGEDIELIDALFCKSKLYREKWNREDYKHNTIKKAIALCEGKFYKNGVNFRMLQKLKQLTPENRYSYNDIGMSELFANMFKSQFRYNTTAKQWYYFNGKVWQEDTGAMTARQKIEELVNTLSIYVLYIKDMDEDKKSTYSKFIKTLGNYNARKRVLEDAQSKMFISQEDFDKNKDLFNCQNGTLNLKTFEFTEHKPADLLSKISNVVYNKEAECSQFKKFMNEVMISNKSKIEFLQKIFGYTLTADTSLEKCFILYGKTTRNGKGTLMDTILYMFGSYGMTAVPETLALKRWKDSSKASGDIARLNGCRFLNISEPSHDLVIDSALLKTLTGRDKIVARFLNQNEFEFYPIFKLFISSNYLPIINDDTVFKSERIKVITFERHFKEEEQDKTLKDKLKTENEISGIFNWCLEGLRSFRKDELIIPKEVEIATAEYERKNDKIAKFFNQELVKNSKKNISCSDAHNKYCEWCDKNKLPTLSKSNFMKYLKDKKLWKKRGTVNGKTVQNIIPGYEFKEKK